MIRNAPKFSDRQVWANCADPDQTAEQGLHCLPFHLHLFDAFHYNKNTSNFSMSTAIFWVSKFFGFLRYSKKRKNWDT